MRVDPVGWWRARSLNERVVAAVLGGSALLLAEIRFEHREVLGETWRAWVPLGYAAALLLFGGIALLRWRRGGRPALAALFALAFVIGAAGVWFHSGGHPVAQLIRVISAWRIPPGQDGGVKIGSAPPVLAPGAFWGLGLIGLIACLDRSARERRGDTSVDG